MGFVRLSRDMLMQNVIKLRATFVSCRANRQKTLTEAVRRYRADSNDFGSFREFSVKVDRTRRPIS